MKETVKYQEVYEFTEEIRPERERGLKWIPTWQTKPDASNIMSERPSRIWSRAFSFRKMYAK